jgi:hypothetical protein
VRRRRCLPSPFPIIFSKLEQINPFHPAENRNSTMPLLPPELWIMIFDMVIIGGIVRLDQCDHSTFLYNHVFLSPGQERYRFYRSYCRLRLVCRSFNALLGTRAHYDLYSSAFPFPMSIRALCITPIGGSLKPAFQQLLADTNICGRLVCLEVSFNLPVNSGQPNLSDILNAGEGGAFPNVQYLAIWIISHFYERLELQFWTRLRRGFAQLVTLSLQDSYGHLVLDGGADETVTFDRLEILCFSSAITCSGCYFPRLRHAAVNTLWNPLALEIFRHSSRLESLLIRSRFVTSRVDVRSFSRLHVLSLPEDLLQEVAPLDCDHPFEHLWLYLADISRNPSLIEEVVKRIPRILRITMDLSLVTLDRRKQRIQELKRMRLDSFGLALRPIKFGDSLLIIE